MARLRGLDVACIGCVPVAITLFIVGGADVHTLPTDMNLVFERRLLELVCAGGEAAAVVQVEVAAKFGQSSSPGRGSCQVWAEQ